jgi:hypothetical protein
MRVPKSTEWIIGHSEQLADMFEQWEPGSEDDADKSPTVALFLAAMDRVEAEKALVAAIATARQAGVTWATIGKATGTTGEAARQRYDRLAKRVLNESA